MLGMLCLQCLMSPTSNIGGTNMKCRILITSWKRASQPIWRKKQMSLVRLSCALNRTVKATSLFRMHWSKSWQSKLMPLPCIVWNLKCIDNQYFGNTRRDNFAEKTTKVTACCVDTMVWIRLLKTQHSNGWNGQQNPQVMGPTPLAVDGGWIQMSSTAKSTTRRTNENHHFPCRNFPLSHEVWSQLVVNRSKVLQISSLVQAWSNSFFTLDPKELSMLFFSPTEFTNPKEWGCCFTPLVAKALLSASWI